MITILLIALVTGQQAKCLSEYGQTVCGYGCVADYGQIKCAQTPQGVCHADSGKITCWDPPGASTTGAQWPQQGRRQPAQANCVTDYGKTACGFSCVASAGQVGCAQTPQGACIAEYGKIVCWDPKPEHCSPTSPKAECRSDYGKIACGYSCVAALGQVQCAQTPQGACIAEYGKLLCWDPPRPTPGAPRAQCLADSGRVACGYGCAANYGQLKCADSPNGVCQAADGKVVCFEPGGKR